MSQEDLEILFSKAQPSIVPCELCGLEIRRDPSLPDVCDDCLTPDVRFTYHEVQGRWIVWVEPQFPLDIT